jgi:hypothetical protein
LPRALQSQLLAALNGDGVLPDEVRLEIAQLGARLYNEQATSAQAIIQNYQGVAEQAQLPFEAIYTGQPIALADIPTAPAPPAPAPAPAPAGGTAQPAPAAAPPAGQAAAPGAVPPSYAQYETVKACAAEYGVTVEQMWAQLPEEERARWRN